MIYHGQESADWQTNFDMTPIAPSTCLHALASACIILRICISVPPSRILLHPDIQSFLVGSVSSKLISRSLFCCTTNATPSSPDLLSGCVHFLPLHQPFLKVCLTVLYYRQVIYVMQLGENVPLVVFLLITSTTSTTRGTLCHRSTFNSYGIPGPHTILPFVSSYVPSTIPKSVWNSHPHQLSHGRLSRNCGIYLFEV